MKWKRISEIKSYDVIINLIDTKKYQFKANLCEPKRKNEEIHSLIKNDENNILEIASRSKNLNLTFLNKLGYNIIISLLTVILAVLFKNNVFNFFVAVYFAITLYEINIREPKDTIMLNKFVIKNIINKPILLQNYSEEKIEFEEKDYCILY